MYDLLVFDLDGTLIDSVGDIADALNQVLGTTFGDGEVAGFIGSGVHELLKRAGAGGNLDELTTRFLAAYHARPCARTGLYLGVRETLAQLGQPKAVATNKPGELSRIIVEQLGIASSFFAVLGEDDVGRKKPDPLIVDLLRGQVGATRARTLFIGDSLIDAATADAARVDLCLVTYGYADPAAIRAHPAKLHLDHFRDLPKLIQ